LNNISHIRSIITTYQKHHIINILTSYQKHHFPYFTEFYILHMSRVSISQNLGKTRFQVKIYLHY